MTEEQKMSKFEMFQAWIEKNLTGRMQALTENPWIGGLTDGLMKLVPLTMISSVVTIYDIVRNYVPNLPSMGAISDYTFGISGLAMAYLIAYHVAERLGNRKKTYVALTSLAVYLMSMAPVTVDEGLAFNFKLFGNSGMFVAIVYGLLIAFIFDVCKKINLFSEDSGMPDFCLDWFDTLIPMAISMVLVWFVSVGVLHVDVFGALQLVFTPLTAIVNSIPGFCIFRILETFMYCCGISTWAFTPVTSATRIAVPENVEAYANGLRGLDLPYHAAGASTTATKGGQGNTMALNILYLFSKSKRLKVLGKVYVLPTILNINEPIVFGTMLWNPTLMIPSMLCEISSYTLWWIFCVVGLCEPQHVVFSMWYCPTPIVAWIINGVGGLLLFFATLAADLLIYYPFFKAYERRVMIEDGEITE